MLNAVLYCDRTFDFGCLKKAIEIPFVPPVGMTLFGVNSIEQCEVYELGWNYRSGELSIGVDMPYFRDASESLIRDRVKLLISAGWEIDPPNALD